MKTLKTNKIVVALMFVCLCVLSLTLSAQSKGNLLYEGDYTVGPVVYPNGMTFAPVASSMHIQVFSEEIVLFGYGKLKYQRTTDSGKRKYTISGGYYGNQSLLVDNNYNMTHYYQVNGTDVTQQYITSGSSMPQRGNNGGEQRIHEGGGNNPTPTPTPTPTPRKTHKCGLCGGTGRVVENNATSFGNTKYCSECGKTVPDSHYHTTCPSCKGKGYW